MPNSNVFTGMDGSITVAVDDAESPEGQAANAVAEAFALSPIGRASNVSVQVHSELRPFHEVGQRYATELRPGNVNITGTMGRAHINGALLRLMLGDAAAGTRPAGAFVSPSFNLSLLLENPAKPGDRSTLTVHGVKLDGWSYAMPEDDFVMEQVTFKALWISVQDATAS
ncbi:hypothetical protein [Nocardioides jejuensis]|uniref:Uncharacterized protein n=1 Tax=Nocardioides jejuensis TaxID=2502782 RepID=A0A4R1CFU5_9ACTN|nr:hypothetical protein [Nocardioides jejuensis]TCJ28938.1 hypothetical protein EPD65_07155 [Nocardioides jejuensis]